MLSRLAVRSYPHEINPADTELMVFEDRCGGLIGVVRHAQN